MKKEQELIEEIARSIKEHRKKESTELNVPIEEKNLAVAYAYINYFGGEKRIWLTTRENLGAYERGGAPTTVTSDGWVVNKNSKFGEVVIKTVHGKSQVPTPKGTQPIEVLNLTSYVPNPYKATATDVVLDVVEGQQKKHFDTLSKLLEIIETEKKIETLEKSEQNEENEQKLQLIRKEKEAEKRKRDEALSQKRSFIRRSAELRHQPILDPSQEETKRSFIYNGTLAIDGGPGTGKTTALIQRIKFLLDKDAMLGSPNIHEGVSSDGYLPDLTEKQKEKLFTDKNSWVFFTPNELLKLFLKDNMLREGLSASDDKVRVWDDYLNVLIKDYGLVKIETQNPFLFLRRRVTDNLLKQSGINVKVILDDFERFLLKLLNSKLSKLLSLDVNSFGWKARGLSIQNYISRQEKDYTLEGITRLYFNLQESYSDEVYGLKKELNAILSNAAIKLERMVSANQTLKNSLDVYAESWRAAIGSFDDAEADEEDEELEDKTGDLDAFLNGKYKILIKNYALSRFDSSAKLGIKYKDIKDIIEQHLNLEELENLDLIGELAYFGKYFVACTKGVARNIFSEIPRAYKAFRKKQLAESNKNWELDLLNQIVFDDKSKNKRLHPQEQSLLIAFINKAIGRAYKVSKRKSRAVKHPYFTAFEQHSTPVIGVDEATDFHVVDLLAMHSLSDLEISSVTYSGDLMQRLTPGGIRRWEDLRKLVKKLEVSELRVSYRQSPTLLDLASFIYKEATNKEPEYKSYLGHDEKEPKALLYKSDNENDKIEWIGERILEIYNAHGRQFIPSVAIFLAGDDGLEAFTRELSEMDRLADVGIKVRASKDGQVLGDKNTVRVFPVQYIKGMEFEAVFFHNMDRLQRVFKSPEMVMKHLYVGLSRASFYMGVTAGDNGELKYLEDQFECIETNWE